MAEYKYINVDLIEQIADGSDELIRDLVEMFEMQAPRFSEQLDDLFTQNELVALSKLAHKIKGTLSTVGVTELAKQMKELEELAVRNDNPKRCKSIINNYKDISQKALLELKDFINRT